MACAVAVVLTTISWPILRGPELRAGRLDAVEALIRVQAAQERDRSAHGLDAAALGPLLGTAARSNQGRHAITVAVDGPESYRATASAQRRQSQDAAGAPLTLDVKLGFAQQGPRAGCWLR